MVPSDGQIGQVLREKLFNRHGAFSVTQFSNAPPGSGKALTLAESEKYFWHFITRAVFSMLQNFTVPILKRKFH